MRGVVVFQVWGYAQWGAYKGHQFWWGEGGFAKNHEMGDTPPPCPLTPLWKTLCCGASVPSNIFPLQVWISTRIDYPVLMVDGKVQRQIHYQVGWLREPHLCLSDCNWTRTHNHLVCKQTLNHLAKGQFG